jgi:hypothetical protein
MLKSLKKIRFFLNVVLLLCILGCNKQRENYPVNFIAREDVPSFEKNTNPLLLVVVITDEGKLSLNKIETGTIDDMSVLSEKLRSIFDDRKKNGITEREVLVEMKGNVKNKDLEKLIENLNAVKAVPISVIKDNK